MPHSYTDNTLANAQVKIDYLKDDVRFWYLDKKDHSTYLQKLKSSFQTFFTLWMLALIIALFLLGGILFISNFLSSIALIEIPKASAINFDLIINTILVALRSLLFFVMLVIFPPLVVSMYSLTRSDISHFLPKFNYFLLSKIMGNSKLRIDKLDKPYFTIPKFQNVMLKYKAFGEFSEYLNGVEVIQYDDRFSFWGRTSKKPTEKWRTDFTFSQIPKDGYLEVEYL